MKRVAFTLAASLISLTALDAIAAPPVPVIKGTYAIGGSGTCITSKSGFDANTLQPILPPDVGNALPNVSSYSQQGTVTYNGDGTGTAQTHVLRANPVAWGWTNNGTPPVLLQGREVDAGGMVVLDFQSNFTYTVNADSTITTNVVGDIIGTETTGSRAGEQVTLDTDSRGFSGYVLNGAKVIELAVAVPTITTENFTPTDASQPPALTTYSVCERREVEYLLK
jgi:hypothetical protein